MIDLCKADRMRQMNSSEHWTDMQWTINKQNEHTHNVCVMHACMQQDTHFLLVDADNERGVVFTGWILRCMEKWSVMKKSLFDLVAYNAG